MCRGGKLKTRHVSVAALLAMVASAAAANAQILEQVKREVTSLQGTAGDVWANSGSGGYVFRFSENVIGDSAPELFVNISTRPNVWAVFTGANSDRYIGQVEIRGGFLLQSNGQSATVLDTYQADAQHKYIVEQTVTSSGVQHIAREVGKDATQAEYEAVLHRNASDNTSWIVPKMEGILLYDLLTQTSPTWFRFDPYKVQIHDGFYRFRRDDMRMKQLAASFTPEVALNAVNHKLGIIQPAQPGSAASVSNLKSPNSPSMAPTSSLAVHGASRRSEQAVEDSSNRRSLLPWVAGGIAIVIFGLGLATLRSRSQ